MRLIKIKSQIFYGCVLLRMTSCVKHNLPNSLPLSPMNHKLLTLALLISISACNTNSTPSTPANPLIGTWELISATSTERDSTVSTFNQKVKMIKMINPTHFAFFSHDLSKGADSTTKAFVAGAGTYTFADSTYTEHLDYFIDREWEGNEFKFNVTIKNDTLTQKGVERIEKLGIDHIIVEKYKKVQ